ncbi:MAG: sigma-70 family RNA polymerase sigma factor [Lachnospiraceae bacterium]|nr:sigma-70 family RNA polymerase sigma factor [Lachnospiraceae bacterium]
MEPYSHEHIRHSFDAYCKQILKNEAIDVERHQNYLRKHEISLSQITEEELEQLAECDTYYEDYQRFRMTGFEVMIKNALLAEALRSLSEDRQEIVLLFYIIGFTDKEIAERMNLVRRTVAYRRNRSLKLMKDFMEGNAHE